jgi:hypothetical protein
MKQKRALHNKPHKTGRKGYHGKRKGWEEEDAKLAAKRKQNPWDQFSGRSRPYLRARVGKKKKNTSEGSGDITFSNHAVVGVPDRTISRTEFNVKLQGGVNRKHLQLKVEMVLSLGLGRMISSPQHLRLHSIEVGSEVRLVHLDVVKGLVKSSLECT